MVNIAVMGYGTVGSGVVEVVNTNGARINQRIGDELNIKYVLDLRDFPEDPVQEKIVHDFETIINDDEIKIVVEVMGGIEPAYTFVKRCLQAGKSVATSNKRWLQSTVRNCSPSQKRTISTSCLKQAWEAESRSSAR